MTELKAHEVDAFLNRKPLPYRLFLVFGPDRGLVSERAREIALASGIALDDPFSVIKIEGSSLQSQPGLVVEEMQSMGLFGGNRLVWLRNLPAGDKSMPDSLKMLAADPPEGSTLIIEAGDLKKGVGLRKTAETARTVVSLPCYADDGRALQALIDAELAQSGLRITPDARSLLADSIGGDRLASRNEIRKLALYCKDEGTIEERHVAEIIGDASAISVDDAVDAVLSGDSQAFLHAAEKIVHSKTPLFLVLQGCLRQFQQLDQMRSEMDDRKLQPAQVLQAQGRPIHFKRKPVLERALRHWTGPAIAREMNRIQAAILQSRQRGTIEESVALHTLLSTTLQSARRPS